nr:SGNH/GDSL hydrolase family protein [Candidatus Sigynarchaeota archaeon]
MDYSIKDLKSYIHGLYWFGKEDFELNRFPSSAFPRLSKDVAFLSTNPAGVRIRFRAKTSGIGVELEMRPTQKYDHFSRAGQCGLDLYIDNKYHHTYVPPRDEYFLSWMEVDGSREHEYMIYLPTYASLHLISVGVDNTILAAKPYAIKKPIVFYGSSITQGAYASRPGLAYPSIIERALDADIINLGFSGNGKGEPEVADLVSRIDASCFVMDWGGNLTSPPEAGLFEQRYRPFLKMVKERHPDTPILCNSLQWIDPPQADSHFQTRCEKIRSETRAVYEEEIKKGNQRIAFIDGKKIIGPDDKDCTADGTHANDLGFHRYVEVILPVLKSLLGVS